MSRPRSTINVPFLRESGFFPHRNTIPGLNNSASGVIGSKTELLRKRRRRKRKRRKRTDNHLVPEISSSIDDIAARLSNPADETIEPRKEFSKKRKRSRRKRKHDTEHVRSEPTTSTFIITSRSKNLATETFRGETQLSVKRRKLGSRNASQELNAKQKTCFSDKITSGLSNSTTHQPESNMFKVKPKPEDDIELAAIVKPVKKFSEEEVQNWNEDVIIIGKSFVEKELNDVLEPVKPSYSKALLPEQSISTSSIKKYRSNVNTNFHPPKIKLADTKEQINKKITKVRKSPLYDSISPKNDFLTNINSTPPFVNLLPRSLTRDIGVDFIPSSDAYLIIIEWRAEWFAQYEFKYTSNPSASLPPILKNASLSPVQNSYHSEKEYYNTFFKLLLVDCWYKLYLCWKDPQLNEEQCGKIREFEMKNWFIKYVVEYFVPLSKKDSMPRVSDIIQIKFVKYDNTIFRALCFVSNVSERKFDSIYDQNNEAFKILNISGEQFFKFKIAVHTVYKCDRIDITKMVTQRKLMNIGYILHQNDALYELAKSPLNKTVLNPKTSPHRLSFSLPDENRSVSIPLNQICEHLLKPEPLLLLVNSSLSSPEKFAAIYYLAKEILSKKSKSKVIIGTKSEKKLSALANELKKYGVVFINDDLLPVMEKYSLKMLIERNMEKYPHLNKKDAQSKVLKNSSVISILLQRSYNFEIFKKLDIACCILDDAHEYTEPESIIPLLYGIKKYVLFGDKAVSCEVSPITVNYDYNRSLFKRAIE